MGTTAYGGKGFKGRAVVSGERPIGTASCRQQHTQTSCQTPLPKQPPIQWCCGPIHCYMTFGVFRPFIPFPELRRWPWPSQPSAARGPAPLAPLISPDDHCVGRALPTATGRHRPPSPVGCAMAWRRLEGATCGPVCRFGACRRCGRRRCKRFAGDLRGSCVYAEGVFARQSRFRQTKGPAPRRALRAPG